MAIPEKPEAADPRQPVILVAEDEVMIRDLLKRVLQGAGFVVLSARDGQEGLEISRTYPGPINLAITDVEMPRLNGIDLIRHLRRERPGIKTLVISGYAEGTIVQEDLTLPVLPKPFDMKVLMETVIATGCCGAA